MSEFDRYAAFHSRREIDQLNPNNVALLPLTIAKLGQEGVGALFVPPNNYDWEGRAVVCGYLASSINSGEEVILARKPSEIGFAPGGVGVVRSRVATPPQMQGLVPIVNDNVLRQLGASKVAQAKLLEGMLPVTLPITSDGRVLEDYLDCIPGDTIALKFDKGRSSQGVRVGVRKQDLAATVESMHGENHGKRRGALIVAQEMKPGEPIQGLRAVNANQQELVDRAEPNGNHELAVYCFADDSDIRPYGVYRIYAGTERNAWLGVDQDTVPPVMFEMAETATRSVMSSTGSPGALCRVDLLGNGGKTWVREINLLDPGLGSLITSDEKIHREQADRLAAQLISLSSQELLLKGVR